MAFLGLLNFSVLILCVLVLAVNIKQAQASSRGFLEKKNASLELGQGLCASSVIKHGYKCQEIEITTKDGYILSLQRIPEGRSQVSGNVAKKAPVIVQHGVLVDGQTWFLNNPEQNLPMILADSGFDVWVSNTRGTKFSRKHTSKDPNSKEYWDWCVDDLVTIDLPTILDYVSKQTGGQKVHYVGHSLGTLVPLVFLSEGKSVDLMRSVALLSPISYLSHITTDVGRITAKSLFGETIIVMGMAKFDPQSVPVMDEMRNICARPGVDCNNMMDAVTGDNCCLAPKAFDQLVKVAPQPTSTKTLMQLAQNVRKGYLAKFDYERPGVNMLHYKQLTPPKYNFSHIPHNVPLLLSYGGKDALSDVQDVNILINDLKLHDKDKLIVQFVQNYAHADFIIGTNANELVFSKVVEFFKRF